MLQDVSVLLDFFLVIKQICNLLIHIIYLARKHLNLLLHLQLALLLLSEVLTTFPVYSHSLFPFFMCNFLRDLLDRKLNLMLSLTELVDLLNQDDVFFHNSRILLLVHFLLLGKLLSIVVKTIFEVLSLIVVLVS